MKLYMKLTGDYFSRNEWGELYDNPDSVDGKELARYQGDIQKGMDHYREGDSERGLMEYYDEPGEIGDKVQRAEFDVEFREGQLWGVAKCQIIGELTPRKRRASLSTSQARHRTVGAKALNSRISICSAATSSMSTFGMATTGPL